MTLDKIYTKCLDNNIVFCCQNTMLPSVALNLSNHIIKHVLSMDGACVN